MTFQHFSLLKSMPTSNTWKSRFYLCFLISLSACGGGTNPAPSSVTPVSLNISASSPEIEAGAKSVSISAEVLGTTGTANWTLEGNLGSLSTNAGNVVEYFPPPTGTVETSSNIKITASISSVSKSITVLLRPSASGVYSYTGAISGKGLINAFGTEARFSSPTDIVVDADDAIYLWDAGNERIRRVTKAGEVTTFSIINPAQQAGRLWYKLRHLSGRFSYVNKSEDLQLTEPEAQLIYPDGRKVLLTDIDLPSVTDYRDFDGNIYRRSSPSSAKSFSVIEKNGLVIAGAEAATLAKDGSGKDARFVSISNLLVFPNRMIYVLDREQASGKYQLRQITQDGNVSTLSTAKFESPARIIPNSGALPTILDRNGIHKLLANGDWNFTSVDNAKLIPGKNTETDSPDATADKDGNIYLSDPNQNRIVRVSPQGRVSVFAGVLESQSSTGPVDGQIDVARFFNPYFITKDRAGNLYVLEEAPNLIDTFGLSWKQNVLTLRKISTSGAVSTLSAPGIWWGQVDTKKTAETFRFPTSLVVDNDANIWIFDRPVPEYTTGFPPPRDENFIFKISPDGKVSKLNTKITDCPPSSREWMLCAITFDGIDNLLIADGAGVQKLLPDGTTTKLPGMESFGPVSALSFDKQGNLFFAGEQNTTPGVYKRSTAALVSKLHSVTTRLSPSMLVDDLGNIYDAEACTLVKITATGSKSVIAGADRQCGVRLGKFPNARLHNVRGLAWLENNSLYATSLNSILKVVIQ